MVFGTWKQFFLNFLIPEETYTVEFVERKQLTVVQSLFSLLASVISLAASLKTSFRLGTFLWVFNSNKIHLCFLNQIMLQRLFVRTNRIEYSGMQDTSVGDSAL